MLLKKFSSERCPHVSITSLNAAEVTGLNIVKYSIHKGIHTQNDSVSTDYTQRQTDMQIWSLFVQIYSMRWYCLLQ